jgi:hypothetical protein
MPVNNTMGISENAKMMATLPLRSPAKRRSSATVMTSSSPVKEIRPMSAFPRFVLKGRN